MSIICAKCVNKVNQQVVTHDTWNELKLTCLCFLNVIKTLENNNDDLAAQGAGSG